MNFLKKLFTVKPQRENSVPPRQRPTSTSADQCLNTELHDAMIQLDSSGDSVGGSLREVLSLVSRGADTNVKDTNGKTLLMYIVANSSRALYKMNRGDAIGRGRDGWDAEGEALEQSKPRHHYALVAGLTLRGANVHAKDKDGWTALLLAAEHSRDEHAADVMRALQEQGADVNACTNSGYTALMAAANGLKGSAVAWLVRKGADVGARDSENRTAMAWAQLGIEREAKYIVKDMDNREMYDDHSGALTHQSRLIEKGREWDKVLQLLRVNDKANALTFDCPHCGQNIEAAPEFFGETVDCPKCQKIIHVPRPDPVPSQPLPPFQMAEKMNAAIRGGHVDEVRRLLKEGANANTSALYGDPSLSIATALRRTEIVMLLLEAGAGVNTVALDGRTALFTAVQGSYIEAVELLLRAGADVNIVHYKRSAKLYVAPLLEAADRGNAAIVDLLLKAAADVNVEIRSNELYSGLAGWTPLIMASYQGHAEVVSLLLRAGAYVNGDSLHWAEKEGHGEVVKLLVAAGATHARTNE